MSFLAALQDQPRLLFALQLRPVQGRRFQPTGFPGLGAAIFETSSGTRLLVESSQSMANRLEMTCWDTAAKDLRKELEGLSHVRIERNQKLLTDSMIEAHRLNSPYILAAKLGRKSFLEILRDELAPTGTENHGVDRARLALALLKYDVGSLIHGVFLSQKELAGGRYRIARALSAFIEADGVRLAPSGGVKNDPLNPSGAANEGYGNVPFARDEFTADNIHLYINLDLSQIRGYGLGQKADELLIILSLYKIRALLDGQLRLRTACDLELAVDPAAAARPATFNLPDRATIQRALTHAIAACRDLMSVQTLSYEEKIKPAKEGKTEQMPEGDSEGEE